MAGGKEDPTPGSITKYYATKKRGSIGIHVLLTIIFIDFMDLL